MSKIDDFIADNPSSGDPTITRPVPWTEPMCDLKTPHSDSAWALDRLEADSDFENQAKTALTEHTRDTQASLVTDKNDINSEKVQDDIDRGQRLDVEVNRSCLWSRQRCSVSLMAFKL